MPSVLTAYSVKIASPGEAVAEFLLAREAVAEWNTRHAWSDKHILLPLDGEGAVSPGDLLVECFVPSRSRPGESRLRGTEAEIEQYLDSGRPALIYVSEARSGFAGLAGPEQADLAILKQRYSPRALVDSYGDEKEFRAKFARDLEATLTGHAYFHGEIPSPASAAQGLSKWGETLLVEACEDFEAYISRIKTGGTLKIQANGKQLVEQGDPEALVRWGTAFEEILTGGFIRDVGYNGQLFQISSKGFDYLKGIGKTPVGYIVEMGGM